MNIQSVLRKLADPVGWMVNGAQYVVFRMAETRNFLGIQDFITPNTG